MLQVGGTNRTFTYDGENRQVAATVNGVSATYTYDGAGQRISRTVGGQTTVYVYDAFGNLAAEYGPSSGSLCGTPTCYLTVDHLGSTRLMTDANGSSSTAQRYDYLPFGEEILAGIDGRVANMGYFASPDTNDPKFTGQYRDPETGLDWFNVRHMSGPQGRFQGVDPANAGASLGDPQTWNGYAYVGNNPLTNTDPSGMLVEAAGACAVNPIACGSLAESRLALGFTKFFLISATVDRQCRIGPEQLGTWGRPPFNRPPLSTGSKRQGAQQQTADRTFQDPGTKERR